MGEVRVLISVQSSVSGGVRPSALVDCMYMRVAYASPTQELNWTTLGSEFVFGVRRCVSVLVDCILLKLGHDLKISLVDCISLRVGHGAKIARIDCMSLRIGHASKIPLVDCMFLRIRGTKEKFICMSLRVGQCKVLRVSTVGKSDA